MESIGVVPAADTDGRETLMLFSGLALVVFGAGLLLSNRAIRGYLGRLAPGDLVQAAVPDIERYLKLRAM